LHFGLLGLLDEDPTAAGWFGTAPSPSPLTLADGPFHCVRVLLGADDADARVRDAYRRLLSTCDLVASTKEALAAAKK
jgi:hypothetical protein